MLVRLCKMEFELKKKGKANPPICSWVTRNKMSFYGLIILESIFFNLCLLCFAKRTLHYESFSDL